MISVKELNKYLNQTAELEVKNGVDRYGHQSYADPVTIPVRREGNIKLVRSTNGEEITSTTTIFSTTQILPLDKIDGNEVINSVEMVNKQGIVIGWECYI